MRVVAILGSLHVRPSEVAAAFLAYGPRGAVTKFTVILKGNSTALEVPVPGDDGAQTNAVRSYDQLVRAMGETP